MSLCPLSWKNVQKINRKTGRHFVQITAHHNHALLCVDRAGVTWWYDPTDDQFAVTDRSSTGKSIQTGEWHDEQWRDEIYWRIHQLDKDT